MENYFNYFTEIEEHFQRRRGGILLLSTLDWALIETWKDAGIPLEAALRGIDAAFDRYEERPSKSRKVNSLAYCAQEVLTAAEDMKEAVVGAAGDQAGEAEPESPTRGFQSRRDRRLSPQKCRAAGAGEVTGGKRSLSGGPGARVIGNPPQAR